MDVPSNFATSVENKKSTFWPQPWPQRALKLQLGTSFAIVEAVDRSVIVPRNVRWRIGVIIDFSALENMVQNLQRPLVDRGSQRPNDSASSFARAIVA